MMNTEDTSDPGEELLKKCVLDLGEHFESVQIFTTRQTDDNATERNSCGNGDWAARFGCVSMWLIAEKERLRERVRSENQ